MTELYKGIRYSGWYNHVLKERANIALSILYPIEDVDPTPLKKIDRRSLAPVVRMDDFITPYNRIGLATLERKVEKRCDR